MAFKANWETAHTQHHLADPIIMDNATDSLSE